MKKFFFFVLGTLISLMFVVVASGSSLLQDDRFVRQQDDLWKDISHAGLPRSAEHPLPTQYRLLEADFSAIKSQLANTPESRSVQGVEMIVPLPDGTNSRFAVAASPIMEPELAKKYPQLHTYLMQGVDDPTASGRLSVTPFGFHLFIQSAQGDFFIDPYQAGDLNHYISYFKRDAISTLGNPVEQAPRYEPKKFDPHAGRTPVANLSAGDIKRTYQLAISATGEYTEFICNQGGDCSSSEASRATAMAAIVTGVNRLNQIYERELSISFVLVNGTDQLVFTDPNADPYSGTTDVNVTLDEFPFAVDGVIPVDDYDLGHVISAGQGAGGGLASTFWCDSNDHFDKATGVTALDSPVGDPFWVDYVGHEVGHQFNANHSYNASAGGSCSTRAASAAYEPASGSTIMSYVTICDDQNLQDQTDAMFNAGAFNEIMTHAISGFGSTCDDETGTGNTAPSVDAGPNYNIPKETPFRLTANISDAEQPTSALTTSWEQFSLGPAWPFASILPNTDQQDGNARPIIRVFPPSSSPVRMVPSLASILDGSFSNNGEDLPSIDQRITFRATVRDNAAGAGGVASDDMDVAVIARTGPFRVTSHSSGMTIDALDSTVVTWDVANTNQIPVSCSAVDISLSLDGGQNFTVNLATSTPNDGSETVTIPGTVSLSLAGRIQVKCSNNIFFDINKANLTITNSNPIVLNQFVYLPITVR